MNTLFFVLGDDIDDVPGTLRQGRSYFFLRRAPYNGWLQWLITMVDQIAMATELCQTPTHNLAQRKIQM